MSEYELFRGTPHPRVFEGQYAELRDEGGLKNPPRAESRGDHEPVGGVMLEFDGMVRPVPVYEMSFGAIDDNEARAIGGLAVNQLVVVSRLAERGAVYAGAGQGFAHPANMRRDPAGVIRSATYAAIPQSIQSKGTASQVSRQRDLGAASKLVNCMPEDMWLRVGGYDHAVKRQRGQNWIDVNYQYSEVGRSAQGIVVAQSVPREVVNVPRTVQENVLLLTHTEAIIEAVRLGIDPAVVSQMVFACGMQRNAAGHQGNTFMGLGYYSERSLNRILREARI